MDRILTLLCTMLVAAALGLAWDRHPPWGLHYHVLWWKVGFDLPDSLQTQRDKAVADLARLKALPAKIELRREVVTVASDHTAAEHQAEIRARFSDLRQKVPDYVPLTTPPGVIGADDIVPLRTLGLLDTAAKGDGVDAIPTLAGQSYDAASGVHFTQLVDGYVANLGIGRQIRTQLLDAQAWGQAQEALPPH